MKLLGKVPDPVLARKAGLSVTTVAKERRRRGIELFQPRRPIIQWTTQMIAVLGTDSDGKVGARLGIPRWSVQIKRTTLSIPPYRPPPPGGNPGHHLTASGIELLGTMPDQKLADLLNVAASAVMRKRHQLGIAPCKPQPRPIQWTKKMISLLGKVTDAEVGRRYGISTDRVKTKRRALGIAARFAKRPVIRNPY